MSATEQGLALRNSTGESRGNGGKAKSWKHFVAERRKAAIRGHRAEMRSAAMCYREEIAPDGAQFGTFSERVNRAAEHLRRAALYRSFAVDATNSLKEWTAA